MVSKRALSRLFFLLLLMVLAYSITHTPIVNAASFSCDPTQGCCKNDKLTSFNGCDGGQRCSYNGGNGYFWVDDDTCPKLLD
jgi:hypothetical protein